MTIVFDASALLGLLSPSELSHADLRNLFLKEDIQAPSLLAWEIGNAICGPTSRLLGAATGEERTKVVMALLDNVRLIPPSADAIIATAGLARRHRLTFYDAAYLELASRGPDDVLVTQDIALAKAARTVMGIERVLDLTGVKRRFA